MSIGKPIRILLLMILPTLAAQAQQEKLYAVFIYSFTKYIEWPGKDTPEFHIQVYGNKEMYNELVAVSKVKKVGDKPIKVTFITKTSELTPSHMLFVGVRHLKDCASLKEALSANNTLLITDDDAGASPLHGINFIQKDGKLAFEIHKNTLTAMSLKVSNELSRLGILL